MSFGLPLYALNMELHKNIPLSYFHIMYKWRIHKRTNENKVSAFELVHSSVDSAKPVRADARIKIKEILNLVK